MTNSVSSFDVSENASSRAKVLAYLRQGIAEGRWLEEERLPAEQKIADACGVSRVTVRGALPELEALGLVKGQKNKGYRVVRGMKLREGIMMHTVALMTNLDERPQPNLVNGDMKAVESGVLDAVHEAGLNLLTLHAGQTGAKGVEGLLVNPPRGLVISCERECYSLPDKLLVKLAQARIPTVVQSDAPAYAAFDRVASDHFAGIRDLTAHLLAQGKRRILRVWTVPEGMYWIDAHNRGCDETLATAGAVRLPPVYVNHLPHRLHGSRDAFEARARHFAGYLLEHLRGPEKADAILVATDCELFPLAAACRLLGVDPTRDVALCGYDNDWEDAVERHYDPVVPFATVDKHNHRIGEELVRMLGDRVSRRLPPVPQRTLVPPTMKTFPR